MWNYRFPGSANWTRSTRKAWRGEGTTWEKSPGYNWRWGWDGHLRSFFLTRIIPMAVRIEWWWGWKQNDRCEEDALVDGWCRAAPRPHSLSYLYTHRALDRGSRRNIISLLFSSDARNTKCQSFNWNITQLTKMTLELVFAVGFSPPSP